MLPLLIGLLVALGPLLRGGWDFWAQSALFLAVAGGFAAWHVGRVAVGYMPLPERRVLLWTGMLAVLAGLSACLSPVPDAAWAGFRVLLLGLMIFPVLTVVTKDQRAAIDEALRLTAWALAILAFYQHYREGLERPPSAFLNQNVFAGTILMLLPLAVQKEDWVLSTALVLCLTWTRSVGAWVGLSAALLVMRRHTGVVGYWVGTALGFVGAVVIYAKLQSPDVLHRWDWWSAAARMTLDRPWLGFGPATFAYVLTAYRSMGTELSAFYAHQHFLETSAEVGLPYLALWCGLLAQSLRRGGAHKRFGAVAVLVQSLWDYALSVPANYWLFCYLVASSAPQSADAVNVPAKHKPAAAAFVLLVAGFGLSHVWTRWSADRAKAAAIEDFTNGASAEHAHGLLTRSLALAPDAQAERMAAEMDLKRAVVPGSDVRGLAKEAADHLERSVARNPFRPSNWAALERLYRQLGDVEAAADVRRRAGARAP